MAMMRNIESVIVVAGCQRSGTTLTAQVLGAHPECLLIDENEGLYEWFEQRSETQLADDKPFHHVVGQAWLKYQEPFRRLEERKAAFDPVAGVRHLVLKGPNLTYHADFLARMDRPVRVVFPVRDPRAVVASMMALDYAVRMDVQQAIRVRKLSDLAERFAPTLDIIESDAPQSIRLAHVWALKNGLADWFRDLGLDPLVFRYEDMVADPEGYRARLYAHCGLSYDPDMPTHDVVFHGQAPGLTDRGRAVDRSSLQKWRLRLSDAEADAVLDAAGPLAARFGYAEPTSPKPHDNSCAEDASIPPPVVLTGRGGSGTRLLTSVVAGSEMFLGDRINATGDSLQWVDTIYEVAARRAKADAALDGRSLSSELETALLHAKARDVLGPRVQDPHCHWGWKLPETMLIVPQVFEAFPNAKLVHLVRHPVTSSLRRTHVTSRFDNVIGPIVLKAAYSAAGRDPAKIESDADYMRNALTWLYQVAQVHDFAETNLTPDNYVRVHFEALTTISQKAAIRIDRFVGRPRRHALDLGVSSGRTGQIDPDDPRIDEVWDLCGALARELGYVDARTVMPDEDYP